jgi:hypothetical protein
MPTSRRRGAPFPLAGEGGRAKRGRMRGRAVRRAAGRGANRGNSYGIDQQAFSFAEATRPPARPLIRPSLTRGPPSPARGAIGSTHPSSISAGSAVPDPCSASRPSPLRGSRAIGRSQERPSLDGLWRASLDPCARLRLLASMVFARRSRPGRPASRSKDHGNETATSGRRSHREAGEAQRSSREAA